MTAIELFELCDEALGIAGAPEFPSTDDPTRRDVLDYIDDDADEEEPFWCLTSSEEAVEESDFLADDGDYLPDAGDFLPLDPEMAAQLIAAQLRAWLADGGWQVQLSIRQLKPHWRLADCLAVIDGGGDRLEGDYPCGTNELEVLCQSVQAVAASL